MFKLKMNDRIEKKVSTEYLWVALWKELWSESNIKNVVEHGRQIIFFMCGLKYEKIYFNVMVSLEDGVEQYQVKRLNKTMFHR